MSDRTGGFRSKVLFDLAYPLNVVKIVTLKYSCDYISAEFKSEDLEIIEWMIEHLPEKERLVLKFRCKDKKNFPEICKSFNMTEATARSLFYNNSLLMMHRQMKAVFSCESHVSPEEILEKIKKPSPSNEHIIKLGCNSHLYNTFISNGLLMVGDIEKQFRENPMYFCSKKGIGGKSYAELLSKMDEFFQTGDYYKTTYKCNLAEARRYLMVRTRNNRKKRGE